MTQLNVGLAQLLLGKDGEVKLENLESEKKYCVGIFADGIYEKRNTPIGSFTYKKNEILFPYLEKSGESNFEFKLPKIPFGLLTTVAGFFHSIMKTMNNSEVMVQIYWNFKREEYFIYVPVQRVAGASISFDHSEELLNNPDVYWVLDIHSHNTMGAFFSGTDSSDERSTRLFGVIGKIKDSEHYDIVLRAGVNGKFTTIQVPDIFDLADTRKFVLPDDIEKRVTKMVYTTVTTVGKPFTGGQGNSYWINKNAPSRYNPKGNSYNGAGGRGWQNSGRNSGNNELDDKFDWSMYDQDDYLAMYYQSQISGVEDIPGANDGLVLMEDDELTIWGEGVDVDDVLFDEYKSIKDAACRIFALKNTGELTVELLDTFGSIIYTALAGLDEFNGDALIRILECASAQMRTEDFDRTIRGFNEKYGYN